MKSLLLILTLTVFSITTFAQSNTPCGLIPPPLLLVNVTCVQTNGTTQGASYSNNAANGGTPSCANPGAPDVWYQFIAPAGGAVNISTLNGTINDAGMALYSGGCPNNFTQIECDDDSGPGLMPQINATGLTSGAIYYIRIWRYGSGTGSFSICLTTPSPLVSNADCANPQPICSGTPITFTANAGAPQASQTNPGNNYGCLQTSPNPSWYYLEIDQGGNLVIDISAGSDVDFAIWGPYNNLTQATSNCNNYPTPSDCSYSTSEIEQVNLPAVQSGEVYILLVTNYANTVQNISVNNNGGTATTNCGILVLPIELTGWRGTSIGQTVELNWETQSESNSSHFAIQRSRSLNFWETIVVVKSIGNSSSENNYSYTDQFPSSSEIYYRLMSVDQDGKYSFSDIISVESNVQSEIVAFPNPSKGTFKILNDPSNKIAAIRILDLGGFAIPFEQSPTGSGMEINLIDKKKGIYFVYCTFENEETVVLRTLIE